MEFREVPFQCLLMSQASSGPVPTYDPTVWLMRRAGRSSVSLESRKSGELTKFAFSWVPQMLKGAHPKVHNYAGSWFIQWICSQCTSCCFEHQNIPYIREDAMQNPPRQNIEAESINYILLTSRHRGYNFEQLILFETRRGLETQYSQVFQICKIPNFSRYFWIEDITPQSPGEPLIGKISNTWKDLTRNQVFSLLEPGTRKRHSKFLEDGIISTQENKN